MRLHIIGEVYQANTPPCDGAKKVGRALITTKDRGEEYHTTKRTLVRLAIGRRRPNEFTEPVRYSTGELVLPGWLFRFTVFPLRPVQDRAGSPVGMLR